ncbi:bifunctional class I SAM-dependent methyltransferase/glycosyltransferase family 2 protein [Thiorhodovibrio frisius]|uniref:Glycosyl transferase n=1 Tax=Thiorhodovibrio frisius TaxID=631362 RepID=H8Z1S2_9GAMM|nr:bifunctional class I SAM-dependent methyltransferase/glycosyltransferase family 2 protein [Thiorhodovibrio frisius]EIC22550.1 glycosyl transferase [Thiorhodovibrio frisius]WPL19991.1 Undecaprenyl-phosphate 4-deoxy-4-formamido-L-arabinose transferase [Thiorhodovibrio frisius]
MPSTFQLEFSGYQAERSAFWDDIATQPFNSLGGYYHRWLTYVYRLAIPEGARVLEVGCGIGNLISALKPSIGIGVDFSSRMIQEARRRHSDIQFVVADAHELDLGDHDFDFIILSDLINDVWDLQRIFEQLTPYCSSSTRIILNYFSHLWQTPLSIARQFRLATPTLTQNWFTRHDVENLLELSGYQPLRCWEEIIVPLRIPLLSTFSNRFLARIAPFRWLALTNFLVARPSPAFSPSPRVSVVVAARNEQGHVDELIERIPEMGRGTEIVFVEGNSTDDTWGTIQRAIAANPQRNCKLLKQPGKGKGDAVRTGFEAATGDILVILDADITVPPEDLPRFFDILVSGQGEFANGVRLVYPMQDDAMRFFNLIGNKVFSWAFSWLLGQPIRDTLCGTKALWAKDYQRLAANRAYFGDFDPFGDFDLLFGAAKLNLKIMEAPIRYRARRYGSTNIQRWRHGLLLARMVLFAARRIKFV